MSCSLARDADTVPGAGRRESKMRMLPNSIRVRDNDIFITIFLNNDFQLSQLRCIRTNVMIAKLLPLNFFLPLCFLISIYIFFYSAVENIHFIIIIAVE